MIVPYGLSVATMEKIKTLLIGLTVFYVRSGIELSGATIGFGIILSFTEQGMMIAPRKGGDPFLCTSSDSVMVSVSDLVSVLSSLFNRFFDSKILNEFVSQQYLALFFKHSSTFLDIRRSRGPFLNLDAITINETIVVVKTKGAQYFSPIKSCVLDPVDFDK